MTIGEKIHARRLELDLTQDGLAALSGVTQANISDIETGKITSPVGKTIIKLATILQVTTDYLLREEEPA